MTGGSRFCACCPVPRLRAVADFLLPYICVARLSQVFILCRLDMMVVIFGCFCGYRIGFMRCSGNCVKIAIFFHVCYVIHFYVYFVCVGLVIFNGITVFCI